MYLLFCSVLCPPLTALFSTLAVLCVLTHRFEICPSGRGAVAVPANFCAAATNCHERKSSPPPFPSTPSSPYCTIKCLVLLPLSLSLSLSLPHHLPRSLAISLFYALAFILSRSLSRTISLSPALSLFLAFSLSSSLSPSTAHSFSLSYPSVPLEVFLASSPSLTLPLF